jgi:RNA polymerase sigma factor (sigma-70 family)
LPRKTRFRQTSPPHPHGVIMSEGELRFSMKSMAGEAEFNEFVLARSAALKRTAYLLTQDHQLAEDLVQTALFKAALRWQRITGDPEHYVRRILYTESVSWWRRRSRRVAESAPRYDEPAGVALDVDMQLSLERALRRLTPRQRAVLVLRYYEDLTRWKRRASWASGWGPLSPCTGRRWRA